MKGLFFFLFLTFLDWAHAVSLKTCPNVNFYFCQHIILFFNQSFLHIWGEIQNLSMSDLTSGTLNSASSRKDYFKILSWYLLSATPLKAASCSTKNREMLLCCFNLLCSKQRIGDEFSSAYKIYFRTNKEFPTKKL